MLINARKYNSNVGKPVLTRREVIEEKLNNKNINTQENDVDDSSSSIS